MHIPAPSWGDGRRNAQMRLLTGRPQSAPDRDGVNTVFLITMCPKFSAIPRIAGAVRLQSETVNVASDSGILPSDRPIRNAASSSLPLHRLTFTESIWSLIPPAPVV